MADQNQSNQIIIAYTVGVILSLIACALVWVFLTAELGQQEALQQQELQQQELHAEQTASNSALSTSTTSPPKSVCRSFLPGLPCRDRS
ncbi:MAG: hypothetical protein CL862_00520 [Cyanobium sp. NAT70]|nr:hypothetical protein [Cyanobium sp. NAT70]|tara:strand:- start:5482 stop:5748 length:267 start_codon:yes stop_codon:yes gene_type:complete